jgi:catechol 2,3-dioxygenase
MTHATTQQPLQAQTPLGIDHLVINVRDIDVAHTFWTECLGFKQVGAWREGSNIPNLRSRMRFYSGQKDGQLTHHDVALLEMSSLKDTPESTPQVYNHVAIAYPSREAWEAQLQFVIQRGVPIERVLERGATCSVHLHDPEGNEVELLYQKPRAVWEHDIDAAINVANYRQISV